MTFVTRKIVVPTLVATLCIAIVWLPLFELGGVPATAIICHERRYPELVRLPVMMGARVLFHPNAGLDALRVSRSKRNGRDGAVPRAFESGSFFFAAGVKATGRRPGRSSPSSRATNTHPSPASAAAIWDV